LVDAAAGSKTIGSAVSKSQSQAQPRPAVSNSPESEKHDPETNQKLRAKLRSDYNERLGEINRRRLGMSSNEGNSFRRRETAKLIKKLAADNDMS
jgi:hypothetical protein